MNITTVCTVGTTETGELIFIQRYLNSSMKQTNQTPTTLLKSRLSLRIRISNLLALEDCGTMGKLKKLSSFTCF